MSAGFALLLLVITIATSRSHDDRDLQRQNDQAGRFDRDTVTSESDRVRLTVELELVTVGRKLLERMDNLTDTLTQRVDRLTDDQKKLEEDVRQCSDAKAALVRDMTDLSRKLTTAERQLSDDMKNLNDKMSTIQTEMSKDLTEMSKNMTDMTSRQTDLAVDMTRLSTKLEDSVYRMSGAGHCGYCQAVPKAKDCRDVKQYDTSSGVKIVNIAGRDVSVYCDQTTDGGGWTVIQRRLDGSVDFYRNWTEYEDGFGNKDGEYWLGLRNIYRMTSSTNYKLRVDLEDFSDNTAYAQYTHFSVSGPETNYTLSVSGYSGTAGHGLFGNNNMQFSTRDRDHDLHSSMHCASSSYFHGAWWYNMCESTNLNGPYRASGGQGIRFDRILWHAWKQWESLKRAEMKIKPV